jgi:hypothetical protein
MDLKGIKFPDVTQRIDCVNMVMGIRLLYKEENFTVCEMRFSQYCYGDATSCRLVNSYQRFGGASCFILCPGRLARLLRKARCHGVSLRAASASGNLSWPVAALSTYSFTRIAPPRSMTSSWLPGCFTVLVPAVHVEPRGNPCQLTQRLVSRFVFPSPFCVLVLHCCFIENVS